MNNEYVGVCPVCQEKDLPVRYDLKEHIWVIDTHESFGAICEGSGEYPQWTNAPQFDDSEYI